MTSKLRVDALWRLFRWLRREKPTILHAWMFHANMASRIVGRVAGVPHIIISRRNENLCGRGRDTINRWTRSLSDRTIAVCESVRDAEIASTNCNAEAVVTIPNGIDLDAIPPVSPQTRDEIRRRFNIPADAIVIGTVARFRPQKAIPDFMRAFAIVRDQCPQAFALVVGDGEERPQIETLIAENRLGTSVCLAGLQPNATELMAAMDIFALPSLFEGMPNVVLEALAMQLPVVATNVGGTPELVEDGVTGWLVEPSRPSSMADKIIALANDVDARQRMGAAGYDRLRRCFTLEASVLRTQALYEELLTPNREPSANE